VNAIALVSLYDEIDGPFNISQLSEDLMSVEDGELSRPSLLF
jgi:hypothetical protein